MICVYLFGTLSEITFCVQSLAVSHHICMIAMKIQRIVLD